MRTLTITDTNVLKGIALLLLLCHHCFEPGQPYDDIVLFGHPVVQNIGEFSKLCVAIFVFFSGYGLTIQTMAKGGIGNVLEGTITNLSYVVGCIPISIFVEWIKDIVMINYLQNILFGHS